MPPKDYGMLDARGTTKDLMVFSSNGPDASVLAVDPYTADPVSPKQWRRACRWNSIYGGKLVQTSENGIGRLAGAHVPVYAHRHGTAATERLWCFMSAWKQGVCKRGLDGETSCACLGVMRVYATSATCCVAFRRQCVLYAVLYQPHLIHWHYDAPP
jgi:hypothetical protein